jgi:hypothetical protein
LSLCPFVWVSLPLSLGSVPSSASLSLSLFGSLVHNNHSATIGCHAAGIPLTPVLSVAHLYTHMYSVHHILPRGVQWDLGMESG